MCFLKGKNEVIQSVEFDYEPNSFPPLGDAPATTINQVSLSQKITETDSNDNENKPELETTTTSSSSSSSPSSTASSVSNQNHQITSTNSSQQTSVTASHHSYSHNNHEHHHKKTSLSSDHPVQVVGLNNEETAADVIQQQQYEQNIDNSEASNTNSVYNRKSFADIVKQVQQTRNLSSSDEPELLLPLPSKSADEKAAAVVDT